MVDLWIVVESQLDFFIFVVRLDPVSNPLLKVNKALLSRLVKIFLSLRSHASDARISYAAELGLDRLYAYHVDAAKLAVTAADPPFVSVNAGLVHAALPSAPMKSFCM